MFSVVDEVSLLPNRRVRVLNPPTSAPPSPPTHPTHPHAVAAKRLMSTAASPRSDPARLQKLVDAFRFDVERHLPRDGKGVVLA